jgi:hypothetical protein
MATYNGNAVVVNVGGLVELLLEVGVLAVRTGVSDMLVDGPWRKKHIVVCN